MPMTESECLEAIARGETAYGLVYDADPKLIKKFDRLCRSIIAFQEGVQTHFPDAEYYTASGGFNLLLGKPHSSECRVSQTQLVALSGIGVHIGDGDF